MLDRLTGAGALLALLLILLLTSCGDVLSPDAQKLDELGLGPAPRATGDVQIVWMGGNGGGATGQEDKLAYAAITWSDAFQGRADRGTLHYVVYGVDGSLHREIVAEVAADDPETGVAIDGASAYYVGVVTYDSKTTAGGHDESGSEGSTGCDDSDADSCGGGGGTDMGGDAGHDEGGCAGHGEDEGPGGPAHPPGNAPRIGQIVAAKVIDGGTPGTNGDLLSWRWFYNDAEHTHPVISEFGSWPPQFCDKPILGGNLVVHTSQK